MSAEEESPAGSAGTTNQNTSAADTGRNTAPKTSRTKAASGAPPLNAIQATRRHRTVRRDPSTRDASEAISMASPPEDPAAEPATPPKAGDAARAPSDPWTVPESIRSRFVQDGHRFYFPDGAPAFQDLGRRLTTPSENTQVVHSLIQIAQARGWSEMTVSGTERFRQEAWRQARMSGLGVRGYRPTDVEQAQLIRAMARSLSQPASAPADAVSPQSVPGGARAPSAPPADDRRAAGPERIVGMLIEHGRDAYRHDPKEDGSYFVSMQTRDGKREIWGKDLERAITKSLTQPQIGDEVVLQKSGEDTVTVQRAERDGAGALRQKEVETHRNRWVVEKRTFFDERARAAQTVRDAAIDPRGAVREHPELAGTYLSLKTAELASRALRDLEDRRRFVAQVRRALAEDVERGEPLQPVRLRERTALSTAKDRVPLGRE
jgi:putative DNA primase/helicase